MASDWRTWLSNVGKRAAGAYENAKSNVAENWDSLLARAAGDEIAADRLSRAPIRLVSPALSSNVRYGFYEPKRNTINVFTRSKELNKLSPEDRLTLEHERQHARFAKGMEYPAFLLQQMKQNPGLTDAINRAYGNFDRVFRNKYPRSQYGEEILIRLLTEPESKSTQSMFGGDKNIIPFLREEYEVLKRRKKAAKK